MNPQSPASPGFLWMAALMGLLTLAPVSGRADDEPGFKPIFDGRSLRGWNSPQMEWWSVEDGSIVGRITPQRPCGTNQYLVWQGGELADFEIKLRSRLRGDGAINNGFQFRSRVLPDGDVAGYQMDNNLQTDWLVRLYDEFGRHTLAWRGKQTFFGPDGRSTTRDLPEGMGPAWFSLGDWHEYHLTCIGPMLTLRVNGRLAAQVEDHDFRRAEAQGAFALQLHSGPPTTVEFRDIRLKILKPASVSRPTPRARALERVFASSHAHWDLAVGGHQPVDPLAYVGSLDDMELNVRAEGPGLEPDRRVGILRGGYFTSGRPSEFPSGNLTVFVHVRDPRNLWNGALVTRAGSFRLAADKGVLRWQVQGQRPSPVMSAPIPRNPPAAWHTIVARYDGRTIDLFLGGECVARESWTGGAVPSGVDPILVGAETVGGKPGNAFHGEFTGTALWARGLTDAEIALLVSP